MAAVEDEERLFRGLFSGHRLIEVHYEDMLAPPLNQEMLDGLQRFLGVEPTALTSPAQKILSDRLGDVIENMAEVEAALCDTPCAWMLDDEVAAKPTSGVAKRTAA